MTIRTALTRFFLQEDINFLLTNRIPRRVLTLFMGWFSKIEQPLVRDLSLGLWKRFAALELDEAEKTTFSSLHDCFIRRLKDGARPTATDPAVLASPCDAIVGRCGAIEGTRVFQAKGFPYTLEDLIGDPAVIEHLRDGCYATLRISSTMYHRFHAPHDCRVESVTYFSGDTWNVNPIALKRVERLFCKNERAAIVAHLDAADTRIVLVPVAAVLVASIRLHFIDTLLHLRYRGPRQIPCDAHLRKGEEMGWFEHGSTIIVFAPRGFTLCDGIEDGVRLRAGEGLMRSGEPGLQP
jgi:phosphatidylserine decarboxylase